MNKLCRLLALICLLLLVSSFCTIAFAGDHPPTYGDGDAWIPEGNYVVLPDGTILTAGEELPDQYWARVYDLDGTHIGTHITGKWASAVRDGVDHPSNVMEVKAYLVSPLGDESLPISALCAMAGVALTSAFFFHRRQKALRT